MTDFKDDIKVIRGSDVEPSPEISVIIPAFNVSQYVCEALDSVFLQSVKRSEVIVVNDGSPDTELLEVVLRPYFSRITYVKQENHGPSEARNVGIRIAKAELVAFLDADDIWFPEYLKVQIQSLLEDSGADVVYPNAVLFGNSKDAGREFMEVCPSVGPVTVESLVLQRCTVMISVVARKNILLRAGMFDSSVKSSEDFDLWLRVLKSGGRINYHRKVLLKYRRRPNSLSADPIWMNRNILKVLAKFETEQDLDDCERAAVSLSRRKIQATLDLHEAKAALVKGEYGTAVQKLKEANSFLDRKKISIFIPLLQIAPRLTGRFYRWSGDDADSYVSRT